MNIFSCSVYTVENQTLVVEKRLLYWLVIDSTISNGFTSMKSTINSWFSRQVYRYIVYIREQHSATTIILNKTNFPLILQKETINCCRICLYKWLSFFLNYINLAGFSQDFQAACFLYTTVYSCSVSLILELWQGNNLT